MSGLGDRAKASRHMAARVGRGAPIKVEGRMRRRKTAVAAVLLAIFALTPLLRWDRDGGPGQAVIADISRQTLYVFDLVFWPQDLPLVVGLLIAGAAGLFAATALWGRVWCGFACPQSVWTDMFFAIERAVHSRIAQPTARKVVLDAVLLALSFVTAVVFVSWFVDALALPGLLLSGAAPAPVWVSIVVGTATTFLLGAKARERVCLHMCPWPRFQSALLDSESLVVTYRRPRGEPRGKARLPLRPDLTAASPVARSPLAETIKAARNDSDQALRGDCIDCGRCVAVCPTSVDIRDGLQMGCIGCGLCIDACDSVMEKLERPRGLIAFDHESALTRAPVDAASLNPVARPRLIRAKTLLFGGVFLLAGGLVLTGLLMRQTTFLSLEPGRNPPFVQLSDGAVRNDLGLKLTLRGARVDAVSVRLEGAPDARLRLAESAPDADWSTAVLVPLSGDAAETRLLVRRSAAEATHRRDVTLVVSDAATGKERARREVTLWGPAR